MMFPALRTGRIKPLPSKYSLSVIVPAYNESTNLKKTIVEWVNKFLNQHNSFNVISHIEFIIINDCSTDDTGEIAKSLFQEYFGGKNISCEVVHNSKRMGLGYNYKLGVKLATQEYVVMIPGDGDVAPLFFDEIRWTIGWADMLIPKTANPEVRSKFRQLLSKSFTGIINTLFGLNVPYYNGCVVHRTNLIRSIDIKTDSFAYQMEAIVKLLKRDCTYTVVNQFLRPRDYGSSKALQPKNIWLVLKAIVVTFWDVKIKR